MHAIEKTCSDDSNFELERILDEVSGKYTKEKRQK